MPYSRGQIYRYRDFAGPLVTINGEQYILDTEMYEMLREYAEALTVTMDYSEGRASDEKRFRTWLRFMENHGLLEPC